MLSLGEVALLLALGTGIVFLIIIAVFLWGIWLEDSHRRAYRKEVKAYEKKRRREADGL